MTNEETTFFRVKKLEGRVMTPELLVGKFISEGSDFTGLVLKADRDTLEFLDEAFYRDFKLAGLWSRTEVIEKAKRWGYVRKFEYNEWGKLEILTGENPKQARGETYVREGDRETGKFVYVHSFKGISGLESRKQYEEERRNLPSNIGQGHGACTL